MKLPDSAYLEANGSDDVFDYVIAGAAGSVLAKQRVRYGPRARGVADVRD
jgi:hypothetical protein